MRSFARVQSPAAAIGLMRDVARALGSLIDRHALLIYAALAAVVLALCRLAIGTFTVEADEAWILLSTYKALGMGGPGAAGVEFPTITSGGLHFLVHGLLGFATQSIAVHRAVSLLFLAALVALVFALMRRRGASAGSAAMAGALVLATPGLVLQASLAMAEIMVTVLLLATLLYWERRGRLGLGGAAITGLLLGLACATRTNCLVCVPVACAFACLDAPDWKSGIARALAMLGAALAVYAAGVAGYAALFTIGDPHAFRSALFSATGVSVGKPLGQQLPFISLAADFFPPAMVAAVVGGLVACRNGGADALRLPLLLAALALAGALAWIARAPIPHVRYAWPFAPLLFIAAGLLMQASGLLAQGWSRLVLHLFTIGAVLQQAATSVVLIATGDSTVAVYQANREAGLASAVARHTDARDQQAMARQLAAFPADATVITAVKALGYPLSYLSGRPVGGAAEWRRSAGGPVYFLVSPADYAVFHPGQPVGQWLARNATPAFRSGDYALYAVTGAEPWPGS